MGRLGKWVRGRKKKDHWNLIHPDNDLGKIGSVYVHANTIGDNTIGRHGTAWPQSQMPQLLG